MCNVTRLKGVLIAQSQLNLLFIDFTNFRLLYLNDFTKPAVRKPLRLCDRLDLLTMDDKARATTWLQFILLDRDANTTSASTVLATRPCNSQIFRLTSRGSSLRLRRTTPGDKS